MSTANEKTPAGSNGEGHDADANNSTLSGAAGTSTPNGLQTTLFDRTDFIRMAGGDESAEIYYRATVMRDFLRIHRTGTFEAALVEAGVPLTPPSPMRAYVVNCRAPKVAMREGWAIKSGGMPRATFSEAAHGGGIRHYRYGVQS